MPTRHAWTLVAGEYPPQFGGVADYTYLVAEALAAAGDEVDVIAPAIPGGEVSGRACVHRLRGGFGPAGLREFVATARSLGGPRRVLVQYVAQSYGMRAVNLPFAWAARAAAGGNALWVMFHEYAIAHDPHQSLPRQVQALGTRLVAGTLARGADLCLVSTSAWEGRVRAAAPHAEIAVVPIPSNIPTHVDEAAIFAARARIVGERSGARVVGHFGTYRMEDSRAFLQTTIPAVLGGDERATFVLLGRDGDAFARRVGAAVPELADRIVGFGEQPARELAAYVAACDVLVQPYAEGVTTRRGSLLGGFGLGVPTVTTLGPMSEAVWADAPAVFTAPGATHEVVARTLALLANPAERARLSGAARAFYVGNFALENTIGRLRR